MRKWTIQAPVYHIVKVATASETNSTENGYADLKFLLVLDANPEKRAAEQLK
jgi:hypothetical protein